MLLLFAHLLRGENTTMQPNTRVDDVIIFECFFFFFFQILFSSVALE